MKIRLIIASSLLLFCGLARGQDISFSNFNTVNGLSDNYIQSIAVDKNGFLWIGTNEGMNSYDGYTVTNYSLDEYPELPNKTIVHLLCDSHNNIWMGSQTGAAWADEKRKFHRIVIDDSTRVFNCMYIEETSTYGPVLFTNKGEFYQDKNRKKWIQLDWTKNIIDYPRVFDVINFNKDTLIVSTDSAVMLVDFKNHKVVNSFPFKSTLSACRVSDNSIAVSDNTGNLQIIDINSGATLRKLDMATFVAPYTHRTGQTEVRPGANGTLLYASINHGFFIIDKDGKVSRFTHDPTNPYSIAANRITRVLGTPNGDIIIGTERYGLSICNNLNKQAGYQKYFSDGKGKIFDGYLTEMIQDKGGTIWMGSMDRLIHWDKKNNGCVFYQHTEPDTTFAFLNPEIYRLCLDKQDQLWVSVLGEGPASFDKNTGKFTLLQRDHTDSSQRSNFIYALCAASDGKIWAGSGTGLYFINPITRKIETVPADHPLKPFSKIRINGIAEDSRHRIWLSTSGKGMICYDPSTRSIKQFTIKEGLLANYCFDMKCSSTDEIYISMFKGFNVIHADGSISTYTTANGLRFDKAYTFVEDNDGKIWIANSKCLAKFDPSTKTFELFDEHDNLYNGGFKPSSGLKTPDGELLWGTQSGINYFYPNEIAHSIDPLQLSVYRVLAGDSAYAFANGPFRILHKNNNLEFDFVAINLQGSRNIRYQYKLEGFDENWQEGTDIRQARYSSLPPGQYTFKVRASADRKTWIESSNNFQFRIIAPLYMRWWFKALGVLLVIIVLSYFYWRRSLQLKKQKEELDREQVINYFASSMYEHQTEDDILWDVARNCIGRLQFEDCVIYLLDEKRNLMVQTAAHGPKSPRSFEIHKPFDIPVGKGIVGWVAQNKKPVLLEDTSKDPRYIEDDEPRLSEICVPIIYNEKVLGVIDCEHSKKRFFTQKHLSILITIASLCANKIVRARTEAEKKQAEIMLVETKQKMAEAEMQALRAQMNPHFIFNCLNSINRYIVKSDQATASLYLTRFAKLIRLILDNSHSKNVILANEIEALRLYIDMESLRFDNKFTYDIQVDKNVHADTTEVPPLIIQPYIENAIWHGLLHKTEGGHLHIHISQLSPEMLQCVIEDNGVGRERAAELKSKSATRKKSLGMELTENRLLLLNKYAEVHSSVEIVDLKNEQAESTGTMVVLKIPIAG